MVNPPQKVPATGSAKKKHPRTFPSVAEKAFAQWQRSLQSTLVICV